MMTAELQELRQHVRWLEDERRDAGAVDNRLNEIDGNLDDIVDRLNGIDDRLTKLADGVVSIAHALTAIADGLHALAPKSPPPSGSSDIFDELFQPTNGRKERPAKPKPRKPKLSVVPKNGEEAKP